MKKHLKHQPPFVQLVIFGAFTLVFLFIGSLVMSPIIVSLYGLSLKDLTDIDFSKPGMTDLMKILQTVVSIFLFFVSSMVFAYLSDSKPWKFAGFRKPVPASFLFVAIITMLAALPFVSWLGEMNQHLHFPAGMKKLENWIRDSEAESNQLLKHFLEMKSKKDLFVMILILAVVPAFIEEVFFRGILQRIFIQVTRRPWAGIIITAIIFSAIHGQFLGFFPRAVLGVILGALFWFSGSLWPGILAHFLNNAMQIVLVYLNPKFAESEPDFSVVIVTLSAAALAAACWWMIKQSQTSYSEVYDTDDDFIIGTQDQYKA